MKRNARFHQPDPDPDLPWGEQAAPALQPAHPVLQLVAEHLQRNEILYSVLADASALHVLTANKRLVWGTRIRVLPELGLLHLCSLLPLRVPPDRRRDVTVLLNDINAGMALGGWVMDTDDGEVGYVVSHLYGNRLEPETMDTLLRVCFGAVTSDGEKVLECILRGDRTPCAIPPEVQRN